MQPSVDAIHELFVGVEMLGSQPDLHLGEEMVIAWRQVRTVRRVVENLPPEELDESICANRGVGPRVVMQENDAFTERSLLFVLHRPLKLMQHFTINLWRYFGPWCHEFCQQNSLAVSHDSVKKFVPFFPVALKKRQGWPHSLSFVKVGQLFCYPPCTELVVTQCVHDSSIQSSPWNLWKFFRKFSYRETTVSTHALVDFLNEFISHSWVSSLTTTVMHISAPIPKFCAPFPHTTVTDNIVTIYTTQSTMNLGRALSCLKKTNHSTYLTAGGSDDDSVHVLSVITPTLRSENVWGSVYSKNRSYLLLLSVRFDAMTMRLFLPTN